MPQPSNKILQSYKFTNCYRSLDRTSQYLIKHIINRTDQSPEDVFFRIILFKLFNKIETWLSLEAALGEISVYSFCAKNYSLALDKLREQSQKIYSAAYIMPSGKREWGSPTKHVNNLLMLETMVKNELHKRIWEERNMTQIFEHFLRIPSIGKFLAYQYATDIAYSHYSEASEDQFVIAGPGAARGIQKCFPTATERSYRYIIQMMSEIQEQEFSRFGLTFQPLKNRPLQLIDCQNLFCEVDKYLRVKRPEFGKPGARIKQHYRKTESDIDYCLPCKWKASLQEVSTQ